MLPYVGKVKRNYLFRTSNFMCSSKGRVLMNAFFDGLVIALSFRFIHSRGFNNNINHLHKLSLGIVYKDNSTFCEDLLKRDKSFTSYERNIQPLALELFKLE